MFCVFLSHLGCHGDDGIVTHLVCYTTHIWPKFSSVGGKQSHMFEMTSGVGKGGDRDRGHPATHVLRRPVGLDYLPVHDCRLVHPAPF